VTNDVLEYTGVVPRQLSPPSVVLTLLPIMAVVFIGFLVIGLALPVLPLHVHQGLGMGTFVVGLVAGSQFAAAVVTRFWSGHLADSRGAKRAVVVGLVMAACAGALYLASLQFLAAPATSATVLILGRALLGAAESCIITGALSWGLALAGAQNTGRVMAWVGTAMYAAYAVGAPLGTSLYAKDGFTAIALATAFVPLATLLVVLPQRPVPPSAHERPGFLGVVKLVAVPGLGLALSSVGFGAITTFITLVFAEQRWNGAWAAFTALSVTFILARVLFGHLPDRIGGGRVALVCVVLEAAGQGLIWRAHSPATAFLGAALTGFGYALVYPAFGVEAVRRAPAESRGLAMGAYTAFLDVALGIANPALGLVASGAGLSAVFLVSALVVLSSGSVALSLMKGDNQ
jgi:MFS family permease